MLNLKKKKTMESQLTQEEESSSSSLHGDDDDSKQPTNQNPHDKRPYIVDLLREHESKIASVRTLIRQDMECQELLEQYKERYDAIWTLRYVLSHKGNIPKAANAAIKTLYFRRDHQLNELGDLRPRMRNLGDPQYNNNKNNHDDDDDNDKQFLEPLPGWNAFHEHVQDHAAMITWPDPNRGVILYVDVGKLDQHALNANLTPDDMKYHNLYVNEAVYQILDNVTRRTGRLTKYMKLCDLQNVSWRGLNRTYIQRDGQINKQLEDYHPQLLGTVFMANPPSWIATVWAAVRPFMPQRMVEKVDFLPPTLTPEHPSFQHILQYVSKDHLPERYCGKNTEWPLPCASTTQVEE